MKKTLLQKYAMVVCFFTLPWTVAASACLIYGLVGVFIPTFTMSSDIYVRFQSNEEYWGCSPSWVKCERKDKNGVVPTEDQVTAERLVSLKREIDKERMKSQQTVVQSLLVLLGATLIFVFHWRIARIEATSVDPAIGTQG